MEHFGLRRLLSVLAFSPPPGFSYVFSSFPFLHTFQLKLTRHAVQWALDPRLAPSPLCCSTAWHRTACSRPCAGAVAAPPHPAAPICTSSSMPRDGIRAVAGRPATRLFAAAAAGGFAGDNRLPAVSMDWIKPVLQFAQAQYLPIALISALLLGASCPSLGLAAAKMHVPAVATRGQGLFFFKVT